MKSQSVLVTGGAGFIGRAVVKRLLDDERVESLIVLDDLSNSSEENLAEFVGNKKYAGGIVKGRVEDRAILEQLFQNNKFDLCIHLAAQINVQESIDSPEKAFESNILGTYELLEQARVHGTKLVLIGTCMVYDIAGASGPISETHQLKPASPYAGSKLAAENLAESYYHAFGLPVTILRPFNTYGPFQKTDMEGGVVSIFIKRHLEGAFLDIFGDGTQTRDLLYVDDCAEFVVEAAFSEKAVGEVINAGTGIDVSVNELAAMVCKDSSRIHHVPHHHPQSEIQKLVCDYSKAKRLLGWVPKTTLEKGVEKTREWIIAQNDKT